MMIKYPLKLRILWFLMSIGIRTSGMSSEAHRIYNRHKDDKSCCKNCRAGGYVLSLDKVSCSHTEEYNDPDYVCDLHRKRGAKGVL